MFAFMDECCYLSILVLFRSKNSTFFPFNCSKGTFQTTDDVLKHCDKEHNRDLSENKKRSTDYISTAKMNLLFQQCRLLF